MEPVLTRALSRDRKGLKISQNIKFKVTRVERMGVQKIGKLGGWHLLWMTLKGNQVMNNTLLLAYEAGNESPSSKLKSKL